MLFPETDDGTDVGLVVVIGVLAVREIGQRPAGGVLRVFGPDRDVVGGHLFHHDSVVLGRHWLSSSFAGSTRPACYRPLVQPVMPLQELEEGMVGLEVELCVIGVGGVDHPEAEGEPIRPAVEPEEFGVGRGGGHPAVGAAGLALRVGHEGRTAANGLHVLHGDSVGYDLCEARITSPREKRPKSRWSAGGAYANRRAIP